MNIEDDIEFVKKYVSHKRLKNDANYHYETEYQKGLKLKSKKYFEEAIGIWTNLNQIYDFSWNYYQIGILENLMGKSSALEKIKADQIELQRMVSLDEGGFRKCLSLT